MPYILKELFGGLGDNLQFSTLPELMGNFYIHADNPFRCEQIYELVWGKNPFCNGKSKESPNIGNSSTLQPPYLHQSIINNWEQFYNLPLTDGIPKIYYEPRPNICRNEVIVDLSAYSVIDYDLSSIVKAIRARYPGAIQVMSKTPYARLNKQFFSQVYFTSSLFDYADTIFSAKKFICLYSGGSVLASAIKRWNPSLDVECFVPPIARHGEYLFSNVRYRAANFVKIM